MAKTSNTYKSKYTPVILAIFATYLFIPVVRASNPTNIQQGEFLVDSDDPRHFSPGKVLEKNATLYGWCGDAKSGSTFKVREDVSETIGGVSRENSKTEKVTASDTFLWRAHRISPDKRPTSMTIKLWINDEYVDKFSYRFKE